MTWADLVPISTGIIYAAGAVLYAKQGEHPFAFVYLAYALACAGLAWAAIAGRN